MATTTSLKDLTNLPAFNAHFSELKEFMEQEHLRRQQFYEMLKPDIKAEFINGEVIIQSPAKEEHLQATENILEMVKNYVRCHQLGKVHTEKALIALERNDFEPDVCFFGNTKANQFTADQWKFPAPDFVVEVLSPKTKFKDYNQKYNDYEAAGVGEYWIVDPKQQKVEQYILVNGRYQQTTHQLQDTIKSTVITNFEIPVSAVFDDQLLQLESHKKVKQEGIEQGILQVAKALKVNGVTVDVIRAATGLTSEIIEQL